jgi:putative NADPH-quinone reductase
MDQGQGDDFMESLYKPATLVHAANAVGQPINSRFQPGYDHSYFFIYTFMDIHGRYNETLHNSAVALMVSAGIDVQQTCIDGCYDIADEVQKWVWADAVVWQMPGWWMGAPWTVKKGIDEVFTAGHDSLYANDGRTRSDSSQKYGRGTLLHGERYMNSATWNAPQQARRSDRFF